MSKAKHTPGPWEIRVSSGFDYGTCQFGIVGICNNIQKREDATLISSAPDLLEALEAMVNGSEWNEERGRFAERILPSQEAFIAARAAIAKARGEA